MTRACGADDDVLCLIIRPTIRQLRFQMIDYRCGLKLAHGQDALPAWSNSPGCDAGCVMADVSTGGTPPGWRRRRARESYRPRLPFRNPPQ